MLSRGSVKTTEHRNKMIVCGNRIQNTNDDDDYDDGGMKKIEMQRNVLYEPKEKKRKRRGESKNENASSIKRKWETVMGKAN